MGGADVPGQLRHLRRLGRRLRAADRRRLPAVHQPGRGHRPGRADHRQPPILDRLCRDCSTPARRLNLSPLLLLFAIVAFGWLWGVVGMVLSVPLVTAVRITLLSFEGSKAYGVLMSED